MKPIRILLSFISAFLICCSQIHGIGSKSPDSAEEINETNVPADATLIPQYIAYSYRFNAFIYCVYYELYKSDFAETDTLQAESVGVMSPLRDGGLGLTYNYDKDVGITMDLSDSGSGCEWNQTDIRERAERWIGDMSLEYNDKGLSSKMSLEEYMQARLVGIVMHNYSSFLADAYRCGILKRNLDAVAAFSQIGKIWGIEIKPELEEEVDIHYIYDSMSRSIDASVLYKGENVCSWGMQYSNAARPRTLWDNTEGDIIY
jgi:hypothetical protein